MKKCLTKLKHRLIQSLLLLHYTEDVRRKTGGVAAIKDCKFDIYHERYVYLGGEVKDGCLHLISEVYGEEYDSEKNYTFTKEDTEKLFQIYTLEEFIDYCRQHRLIGMEYMLQKNNINPTTFVW